MEAIRAKQREAERIKARLTKEKQFNKSVAIKAELWACFEPRMDTDNHQFAIT